MIRENNTKTEKKNCNEKKRRKRKKIVYTKRKFSF